MKIEFDNKTWMNSLTAKNQSPIEQVVRGLAGGDEKQGYCIKRTWFYLT